MRKLTKKMVVVRVLKNIISDELFTHSPSFVQVQVSKFNQKLEELKNLLSSDKDSLYTPILSALVGLASERQFSDPKILRQILQNLNRLQASLVQFRQKEEAAYTNDTNGLHAQLNTLRSELRTYRRSLMILNYRRRKQTHLISYAKHSIAHFNRELQRFEGLWRLAEKIGQQQIAYNRGRASMVRWINKVLLPYVNRNIQALAKK